MLPEGNQTSLVQCANSTQPRYRAIFDWTLRTNGDANEAENTSSERLNDRS